jgi:hypothetical protein
MSNTQKLTATYIDWDNKKDLFKGIEIKCPKCQGLVDATELDPVLSKEGKQVDVSTCWKCGYIIGVPVKVTTMITFEFFTDEVYLGDSINDYPDRGLEDMGMFI